MAAESLWILHLPNLQTDGPRWHVIMWSEGSRMCPTAGGLGLPSIAVNAESQMRPLHITDTWVTGWKLIWATLSPSTCPVSRMENLAVVITPKGLGQASPHWLQRLGVSYHILYWRSSTRTSFSCFDLSFSKLGFIYNSKRYQPNKQWRRSWNCWPKFLYEIIDNNKKRWWKGKNKSFKKWIIILFSLFS